MNRILILLLCIYVSDAHAQTIMNIYRANEPVLQIPISDIDSITYSAVGNPGLLPEVVTFPLGAFTSTSATLGGEVIPNGGSVITQRGVCWSTFQQPTTADSTTSDGNGTGSYESVLIDLEPNITYYCRAYATNGAGTSYGNEVSFVVTTDLFVATEGITDSDGNEYPTILMGNGQEWMTENLRSVTYANGDAIPNILSDSLWAELTTGSWAYYNNNEAHDSIFGKLYNGWAVADPRNVCPIDWHVPTDDDWTELTDFLGGLTASGGKWKGTGFSLWLSPNSGATNESGLTGLPGGFRNGGGIFSEMFGTGSWWASTGNSFTLFHRTLYYTSSGTWRSTKGKAEGLSVRCLHD